MKALGIAMKLTLQGQNQLIYPETSVFAIIVLICVLTQMNYLNKVPNQLGSYRVRYLSTVFVNDAVF